MGCVYGNCSGSQNKNEKPSSSSQGSLLAPQAPLKGMCLSQKVNKQAPTDVSNINDSDDFEPSTKKVNNSGRVAKVPEVLQVILFLHGLHRLSYDFEKMKADLQKKFPDAKILALKCVNKDPNKQGHLEPSPTLEFSIQEQAKRAYEEIKKRVPRGSHIVLVGHSQGGLRAFTLAKEYGSRLESEDEIFIDKLVTIGTPWKGAPIMNYIKNIKKFKEQFDKIETTLNRIKKGYSKAVRGYFFKVMPGFANSWPWLYEKLVPYIMEKKYLGAANLDPGHYFIRDYIPSALKEIDLPITAIAGVLTDFSKLFAPLPSSILSHELAQLNATYAELIGGDAQCEHDMLLPVATQHAEGLATKNFKRIKVYGACHGNKVGVAIKRKFSELNNQEVIDKVAESIEEVFYEEKEAVDIAAAGSLPSAA
ncbi:alpha/beta hydrolase [Cardinium endosymbiont of Philonthus spinipes]|uniref:esterase/lipase family protein n=1 Tax=Cardinium endosymbiont of Philonthus spinipes TaxID=3077941 RepID=UPI00313C4ABE